MSHDLGKIIILLPAGLDEIPWKMSSELEIFLYIFIPKYCFSSSGTTVFIYFLLLWLTLPLVPLQLHTGRKWSVKWEREENAGEERLQNWKMGRAGSDWEKKKINMKEEQVSQCKLVWDGNANKQNIVEKEKRA